jgi:DNA-binding transcriptional regulator YhcF (GntR family)
MILTVDLSDDRALYQQIADGVEAAVADGRLQPGDRLPAGRELAAGLGVNLETVQRAYRRLVADGVATSRVGRGTRVADDVDPATLGVHAAADRLIEAARSAGLTLEQARSLVGRRWSMDTP